MLVPAAICPVCDLSTTVFTREKALSMPEIQPSVQIGVFTVVPVSVRGGQSHFGPILRFSDIW